MPRPLPLPKGSQGPERAVGCQGGPRLRAQAPAVASDNRGRETRVRILVPPFMKLCDLEPSASGSGFLCLHTGDNLPQRGQTATP